MIIPDLNLLLYAHSQRSERHEPARKWWEKCLSGQEPVGIPWVVVLGFLRLTTNRRVFEEALPVLEAASIVRMWLASPPVQILDPGPGHAGILLGCIEKLGTAGNLTTDAHLAALAIEHQALLHTADADFTRFSGLRWINPLRPPRAVRARRGGRIQ